MLCKDTQSMDHSPVPFDCNRNNSEWKALFDSEHVEDRTEFSRVNDWFLCKSKHNFDGMQRTLFDPAKNNSGCQIRLKNESRAQVFWYISKMSERLPNFRRLAHILLKRSHNRIFIKKIYRAQIRETVLRCWNTDGIARFWHGYACSSRNVPNAEGRRQFIIV